MFISKITSSSVKKFIVRFSSSNLNGTLYSSNHNHSKVHDLSFLLHVNTVRTGVVCLTSDSIHSDRYFRQTLCVYKLLQFVNIACKFCKYYLFLYYNISGAFKNIHYLRKIQQFKINFYMKFVLYGYAVNLMPSAAWRYFSKILRLGYIFVEK